MKYTITIFTANKPGVLYRIADLLLRRRINIDSLSVREANHVSHVSEFTIELECDKEIISKLVNQIKRIVEVKSIEFC